MKNRKLSRDIPPWFDLTKYEKANTFTSFEWAWNLIIRKYILDLKLGEDFRVEMREIIKECGALPTAFCEDYVREEMEIFADYGGGGKLVYGLSVSRAYEIYKSIKRDTILQHQLSVIEYQHMLHHKRDWQLSEYETELEKWHKEIFLRGRYDENYDEFGSYSPHVCVDLEAPDEVLLDAFKTWLSEERRKTGQHELSPRARKADRWNFSKWCEYAVLPYLDLMIHQAELGIKLTANAIGNAIFAADVEFDTTEAVRKTTVPYMEAALAAVHDLKAHGYYEKSKNMEKI